MRKLTVIFLFLIPFLMAENCNGQAHMDSLWFTWRDSTESDTNRLEALEDFISDRYLNTQPDSTIYLAQLQFDFASKSGIQNQIVSSLNSLGISYRIKGEYQNSLNYYNRALKINRESSNQKEIGTSFANIGIVYYEQGDYANSIVYFHQALKIVEFTGDEMTTAQCLLNIGNIYNIQGDYTAAINNYMSAFNIYKNAKDKSSMALIYGNIGTLHEAQENYPKAKLFYRKSLTIYEEIGEKEGIAFALGGVGGIYFINKNYDEALNYYSEALKIVEEIGDQRSIASSCTYIADIYYEKGDFATSISYAKRALDISTDIGALSEIKSAAFSLYMTYKMLHKNTLALEMFELYISSRDSIESEENDRVIIQQQYQYKYEKQVATDSIENVAFQKINIAQLDAQKAESAKQQQQKYYLFGGFIIAVFFGGFIYNRFKNSQKQKRVIEEQKTKIISSINYAKKIQYSILPSEEEISRFFPNHFIFFKPKDIVSGDFYWFHHENNLSFFAVADCTGHGVPGAFMTMIAHSILLEVVVEQKITQPDKILSNLHQLIFKNLQQQKGDEYSQDGMDISLCVIDHEKNKLHFSGARNHAYVVDSGVVKVLKATAKSIGGLSLLGEIEPERSFKSETITLTKDALIVLTTDGIFDQLNTADEKFGTVRFRELISELCTKKNDSAKASLESVFKDWQKNAAQLDDILVVGIKL